MLSYFFTVGGQVLILFVLIAIGFLCAKGKLVNAEQVKGMTNIVLYIVTPSVMINSFQRSFDNQLLHGLLLAFAAAFIIHFALILLSCLLIHDRNEAREKVYRFSVIFSNCGFMSLPLQAAILGDIGLFYGSAYIASFNMIAWTYGIFMMSGDKKQLSLKMLVKNPGILGVVAGLLLFFTSFKLPEFLSAPVASLAALNTPVPMLIIGWHLAHTRLLLFMKEKNQYLFFALRLLVVPLLSLLAMLLLKLPEEVIVATTIAASAPAAALTTMFADRFGCDTELSATLVSLSTLLSLATMPFVIGLAQYFV